VYSWRIGRDVFLRCGILVVVREPARVAGDNHRELSSLQARIRGDYKGGTSRTSEAVRSTLFRVYSRPFASANAVRLPRLTRVPVVVAWSRMQDFCFLGWDLEFGGFNRDVHGSPNPTQIVTQITDSNRDPNLT